MNMNRRIRNLIFVFAFFLGSMTLVGIGQMSINEIKNSMGYEIEEKLLEPVDIERIV